MSFKAMLEVKGSHCSRKCHFRSWENKTFVFMCFVAFFPLLGGCAEEPLNAGRGDNRPLQSAVLEQMRPHSPGLGLRYFLFPQGGNYGMSELA